MNQVRVLVAEDNPDHRFLLIRALRSVPDRTVNVDGVSDGEEALDYLLGQGSFSDRELPHLVFLDLRMPKVSGLEVLHRVKSDEALSHIPVVVLTSSTRVEDVDSAYRAGGNSYVPKPPGAAALREVAEYWLRTALLPQA
jgi:CheY-like chemotaxis protein